MKPDPKQPPMTFKGTSTGRSLGGSWLQLEHKAEIMGMPWTGGRASGRVAGLVPPSPQARQGRHARRVGDAYGVTWRLRLS